MLFVLFYFSQGITKEIVSCKMGSTERGLYRKAQLWLKKYLRESVLDPLDKHIFELLLRLRQMAIHWSLVLRGNMTM